LEFIGFSPQQADDIECLAPLWRKLPCWLYYYKVANQLLAENLANPNAWNASCFDGIRRCRGLYSCQGCEEFSNVSRQAFQRRWHGLESVSAAITQNPKCASRTRLCDELSNTSERLTLTWDSVGPPTLVRNPGYGFQTATQHGLIEVRRVRYSHAGEYD
jgi:hypothetical protein